MKRGICCKCEKEAYNEISYYCNDCLEKEVFNRVTQKIGG